MDLDFKDAVKQAEKAGACGGALGILRDMNSWDEFFEHERAPSYSLWYAQNVLNGRFELAEPAIAKDLHYSYFYALNVLNGRFELGETAIAENAPYAYLYAKFLEERSHENN